MKITPDELASTCTKAIQQAVQHGYYIVFDRESDLESKTIDPLVALAFYLSDYDRDFEDSDGELDPREVASFLEEEIGLTWDEALEFDRGCIKDGTAGTIWKVARQVCNMIEGLSRNNESE